MRVIAICFYPFALWTQELNDETWLYVITILAVSHAAGCSPVILAGTL